METIFVISLLLIAVFALLVQRTRTRNPGVPGPRQLPIIGNLLDILPHAKNRRPGDLFKRVAVEFGPVSQVTLPPGADIVLISDPALARRVLRTDGGKIVKDDEFMKAMDGIAPFGLFALPDGEIWTRHRKKLQPAFGPLHLRHALEIVRRMSSQLYEHCDKLINTGEMERKGTDFYTGFTCAVADVLGHLAFSHDFNNIAALSQPDADRSTYNQLEFLLTVMTKRVFHVSRPFWGLAGVGKSAVKPVGDKVRATLQKVIESRRGNVKRTEKEMDVLDRLLAESEDGEPTFTTDEVMDEVVAFYMAGQDAMANALVWFLYALCLNPEAQDKIHEEVTRVVQDPLGNPTYEELPSLVYLDAAFRESMRLYTTLPVPAPRTVVSPTELGGHIIQPGTKVIVNFAAMHMNPKFWPNPTEYLPERFLDSKETSDAFMPFSDGGHMCPGYRLAYVQAKGYFAPLMRRYRCELVEGQTFEAVEAISTGLRDGMRVRMRRR